jgi:hypothetical protein
MYTDCLTRFKYNHPCTELGNINRVQITDEAVQFPHYMKYKRQMYNQRKLRIHNITAKAALKYGSETWMLNKRDTQCLGAA